MSGCVPPAAFASPSAQLPCTSSVAAIVQQDHVTHTARPRPPQQLAKHVQQVNLACHGGTMQHASVGGGEGGGGGGGEEGKVHGSVVSRSE